MSKASIAVVGGLLVDEQDRVLLGLRASWKKAWPDCWDAVGGHVEPGELVEQALIREIREEIGVSATGIHFLALVENPGPTPAAVTQSHIFAVTSWTGGRPYNACDEHSEIRWFSLVEVRALSSLAGEGYLELAARAIAVRHEAMAGRRGRS